MLSDFYGTDKNSVMNDDLNVVIRVCTRLSNENFFFFLIIEGVNDGKCDLVGDTCVCDRHLKIRYDHRRRRRTCFFFFNFE